MSSAKVNFIPFCRDQILGLFPVDEALLLRIKEASDALVTFGFTSVLMFLIACAKFPNHFDRVV